MPKLRTVFLSTLCALLAMALFIPSAQAQRVDFNQIFEIEEEQDVLDPTTETDDELCEELLADEDFDGVADCFMSKATIDFNSGTMSSMPSRISCRSLPFDPRMKFSNQL